MNNNFSIGEALSFSFGKAKQNLFLFIKVLALIFLIYVVLTIPLTLVQGITKANPNLNVVLLPFLLIFFVAQIGIQIIATLGFIRIPLKIIDSKNTSPKDLFEDKMLLFNYLIATIIYFVFVWAVLIALFIVLGIIGLILWFTVFVHAKNLMFLPFIIGGTILFIVSIYMSLKYRYYPYFIVDRKLGPVEALSASSKITKSIKFRLFIFSFILGILNILGLLVFVVGIIFTLIMTLIAEAYVFRKLSSPGVSPSPVPVPVRLEAPKMPEPPLVVPDPTSPNQ